MNVQTTPQAISERKPDPRKSLRAPMIVFRFTEEDGKYRLFGYAKNVSRSGLFIQSINPRNQGDQFLISFRIPNTEIEGRCRCEVVWNRKFHRDSSLQPGYGVRFLDLPSEVAEKIDQWVNIQTESWG